MDQHGLIPRLCTKCSSIDFEMFMAIAELERPGNNTRIIRKPNGKYAVKSVPAMPKYGGRKDSMMPLHRRSLEEIIAARPSCDFCALMLDWIQPRASIHGFSSDEIGRTTCFLFPEAVAELSTIDTVDKLGRGFKEKADLFEGYAQSNNMAGWSMKGRFRFLTRIGVSVRSPGLDGKENILLQEHHAFHLCASDEAENFKSPTGLGHVRGPRIDLARVKTWLDLCSQKHSETCGHSAGPWLGEGRKLPKADVRLVDVEDRCIKTFPCDSATPSYVALSYVWGVPQQKTALMRGAYDLYCQPGGVPTASQTIEDAMLMTRSLGLKYLWVDVLCILQDDPQDKAKNIANMSRIYSGAYLTIAAASSTTTVTGIPGVSRDRAVPSVARISKDLVVSSASGRPVIHNDELLLDSAWPTRAWTLQELLLSRRCLICCDDQVIFLCQAFERFEDIAIDTGEDVLCWDPHAESRVQYRRIPRLDRSRFSALRNYRHARHIRLSEGVSSFSRAFHEEFGLQSPWEDDPRTFHRKMYRDIVADYTKRELTVPADIVDAFTGVLSTIPQDTFWGLLVEANFAANLCWQESSSRTRDGGMRCPRRRRGFQGPSWSWMSWECPAYFVTDRSVDLTATVACFRVSPGPPESPLEQETADGSGVELVPVVPLDQAYRPNFMWSWQHPAKDVHRTPVLNDIPQGVRPAVDHMMFWADVIRLPVRKQQSIIKEVDTSTTTISPGEPSSYSLYHVYNPEISSSPPPPHGDSSTSPKPDKSTQPPHATDVPLETEQASTAEAERVSTPIAGFWAIDVTWNGEIVEDLGVSPQPFLVIAVDDNVTLLRVSEHADGITYREGLCQVQGRSKIESALQRAERRLVVLG